MPNGKGILIYPGDHTYQGDFVNGIYSGKYGLLKWDKGGYYKGSFLNGKFNGKGYL